MDLSIGNSYKSNSPFDLDDINIPSHSDIPINDNRGNSKKKPGLYSNYKNIAQECKKNNAFGI
jgi:hypothetical protein